MENILKFLKKSPVMAIILGYILLIVVQHFFDILHFIPILLQHIATAEGALHSLGFLVTFGALVMSYKSFKTASLRAAAETIAQAENYVRNNVSYLEKNRIKYGAHLDLTGALELLHKNGRNFTYLHLPHAFLLEANLQGANFMAANLQVAILSSTKLQGANFTAANLMGANLQGANLTDANLQGADLYYAKLTGADLKNATLIGANLASATLIDVKGLTREQILSAKWVKYNDDSTLPTLPKYITHPDGVEDEDIARWLATPSRDYSK